MNMIPRARLLYTSIWHSEQVTQLKPLERLLFIGMVTIADDDGRFKADERFLNSQIFPYDSFQATKVAKMRENIHSIGLIYVYKVENTLYAVHPNWTRFQKLRLDRVKPSEIPPPVVANLQPNDNHTTTEENVSEEMISKEKIEGNNQKKSGRDQALDAWKVVTEKNKKYSYESKSAPQSGTKIVTNFEEDLAAIFSGFS